MSIFDTLFGVSDARVDAARIDGRAGSRAIQQRSQMLSSQLGNQQYSLAAGARGSNSTLALREAQRRSQLGQQQIGAAATAEEANLQQAVAQANQQAQMQANVANANIEMQNDQAFSRGLGGLISTGATAALLMSDVRAKEDIQPLYSDFADKEPVGRFGGVVAPMPDYRIPPEGPRPAPARVVIVPQQVGPSMIRPAPARTAPEVMPYRGPFPRRPDAESRAAFGLDRAQRPTTTLEQGAIERNTIDAIRNPGGQPAQYQSQMLSPRGRAIVARDPTILSNRGIATHLRDRREAAELEAQTEREAADPQYNPLLLSLREYGRGMMSDFRSKELMKARPSSGSTFDISGDRVSRMARTEFRQREAEQQDRLKRAKAFKAMREMRGPDMRRTYDREAQEVAMSSDFAQKEMTAAESREALAPVRPVNYRYRPEAAARMAMETGATPAERAMVFRDKRAPRDGIIAQDLQRSPAFASSVMNTPAGLAVDRDRATSVNLAATAGQAKVNEEQDEEIRDLKRMLFRVLRREVTA